MENYNIFENNQNSPILEALNRSNQRINSFKSVYELIRGLLGNDFNINFTNSQEFQIDKEVSLDNSDEIKQKKVTKKSLSNSSIYKIYRDKKETFECDISVKGAKLSDVKVRLVFDHEICNLVFYGNVNKDGKCTIPLKKMSFYPENTKGKVRLEVIIEDNIFIPWEETFIVKNYKKVKLKLKNNF